MYLSSPFLVGNLRAITKLGPPNSNISVMSIASSTLFFTSSNMSRDCERISSSPSLQKASSRSCLSRHCLRKDFVEVIIDHFKQTFGRIVHFERTHEERSGKKSCCTFWQKSAFLKIMTSRFALGHYF